MYSLFQRKRERSATCDDGEGGGGDRRALRASTRRRDSVEGSGSGARDTP